VVTKVVTVCGLSTQNHDGAVDEFDAGRTGSFKRSEHPEDDFMMIDEKGTLTTL